MRPSWSISAAALAALIVLSGCLVLRDSPAPGCRRTIGIPVMGGCLGKAAIVDLTVDTQTDCLTISPNNCNGGVLTVDNACSETLSLGGIEIAPAQRESLDITDTGDGRQALVPAHGNFSSYLPEQDQLVVITGSLGADEIRVTFTKTGPLCN